MKISSTCTDCAGLLNVEPLALHKEVFVIDIDPKK